MQTQRDTHGQTEQEGVQWKRILKVETRATARRIKRAGGAEGAEETPEVSLTP
jgi:hypothetical protein